MLHIVIMAGGAGTRFWPESRTARPKQLLPLAGSCSMLQMTVDRLGDLADVKNIYILTAAALTDAVAAQLPQLPRQQILGEPCKRDTAPCIGLAALLLARTDPNATMVVMPADQVIHPDDQFQQCLKAAAAIVDERPDQIVTFGIKPTYPATTFGYIEKGASLPLSSEEAFDKLSRAGRGEGRTANKSTLATVASVKPPHPNPLPGGEGTGNFQVFNVLRFREKPPLDIAKEYLASGNFFWNSGIFVWKASTIISALEERQPEMLARLKTIVAAWGQADFNAVFAREFAAIKGISIDYAVMEQAKNVAVIQWAGAWSDVGSWQAAAQFWPAVLDENGNRATGRHVGVDTKNCLIRGDDKHVIATIGVSDLIVVHTPDATLVANRNDEDAIKKIVKLLEERGWTEYL